MGEGGRLNIANVTPNELVRSSIHSYQMNAWGTLPTSVAAFGSAQAYVEWDQGVGKYVSDDAGEALYSLMRNEGPSINFGSDTMFGRIAQQILRNPPIFEIQARWKHLQVCCKNTDANCVVGVLKGSNLYDGNIPDWYPLKQDACYDIGWNHDGDMSVALVDLRVLFDGPTLEQYKQAVTNGQLSDTWRKTLYAYTQAGSGYKPITWSYQVVDVHYQKVELPQRHSVQVGTEEEVFVPDGAKTTHKFSQTLKRTDTFTWGFKETLAVGVKVTVKAGIPGVGEASGETSLNLSLEANQQKTTTEDTAYTVEDTVELSKPGQYKISGYVDIVDDLEVPFEALCHVTANQGDYKLTACMIDKLLQSPKYGQGFSGKIDKHVDDYQSAAVVRGSVIGSYGIKRFIIVAKENPETRASDVVNKTVLG